MSIPKRTVLAPSWLNLEDFFFLNQVMSVFLIFQAVSGTLWGFMEECWMWSPGSKGRRCLLSREKQHSAGDPCKQQPSNKRKPAGNVKFSLYWIQQGWILTESAQITHRKSFFGWPARSMECPKVNSKALMQTPQNCTWCEWRQQREREPAAPLDAEASWQVQPRPPNATFLPAHDPIVIYIPAAPNFLSANGHEHNHPTAHRTSVTSQVPWEDFSSLVFQTYYWDITVHQQEIWD